MRLTVLICTYNGTKHLATQVKSIADQTRRPDQILINDDCSTDDTLAVAEHLGVRLGLPIEIAQNSTNLNVAGNFSAGLERIADRSAEHIVFLSDQDDIWRPTKIEDLLNAFDSDPAIGLAFCDAELADADLQPTGVSFLQSLGVDDLFAEQLERDPIRPLLHRNYIQGAACAFRATYIAEITPIPSNWWYDHWIGLQIAAHAPFKRVPKPLNLYRQHAAQVQGGRPASAMTQIRRAADADNPIAYHLEMLDMYREVRQRFAQSALPAMPGAARQIARRVEFCEARVSMRRNRWRRPLLAVDQLLKGHYALFAQGFRSFAYDLAL